MQPTATNKAFKMSERALKSYLHRVMLTETCLFTEQEHITL